MKSRGTEFLNHFSISHINSETTTARLSIKHPTSVRLMWFIINFAIQYRKSYLASTKRRSFYGGTYMKKFELTWPKFRTINFVEDLQDFSPLSGIGCWRLDLVSKYGLAFNPYVILYVRWITKNGPTLYTSMQLNFMSDYYSEPILIIKFSNYLPPPRKDLPLFQFFLNTKGFEKLSQSIRIFRVHLLCRNINIQWLLQWNYALCTFFHLMACKIKRYMESVGKLTQLNPFLAAFVFGSRHFCVPNIVRNSQILQLTD